MPNGKRLRQPGEIPFWEYETPTPFTFYQGTGVDVAASYDYLGWLQSYLQSLISKNIGFSVEMAATIYQQNYDELFPKPQWKTRKPTELEIRDGASRTELIGEWAQPSPKPIRQMSLWTTLQNFHTGLAEDVRKTEETNIAQAAEAQSSLIAQQALLPLGKGGSPTEQMWTASDAIRKLRLQQQQLQIQAQTNPYLESTIGLIEEQVGQLSGAQGILREQVTTQARLRGLEEEKRQRLQEPLTPTMTPPPAPEIQEQWQAAMKDLPYTAQRHFGGQLGEFFGRVAPAYERWYQALYSSGFQQYRTTPSGREPYPGDVWAELAGGVMPEGLPTAEEWEAQQVEVGREASAAQRQRQKEKIEKQAIIATGDPFKQYLAQFPFMSEFMQVPPRQRGFYPGRSAPRARWYT